MQVWGFFSFCGKELCYLFISMGTPKKLLFCVTEMELCSNSLKIISIIPDLDNVTKTSIQAYSNQLTVTAKTGKPCKFSTCFPSTTTDVQHCKDRELFLQGYYEQYDACETKQNMKCFIFLNNISYQKMKYELLYFV